MYKKHLKVILAASNIFLQRSFKVVNTLEKFYNQNYALQSSLTSFQPFLKTNIIIYQNDSAWESTGNTFMFLNSWTQRNF